MGTGGTGVLRALLARPRRWKGCGTSYLRTQLIGREKRGSERTKTPGSQLSYVTAGIPRSGTQPILPPGNQNQPETGERIQEPSALLHEDQDKLPPPTIQFSRSGTVSSLRTWTMNQTPGLKSQLHHICGNLWHLSFPICKMGLIAFLSAVKH